MKRIEKNGFVGIVTRDKIKIEIPISNVINAFNYAPNNYDELTIKRGNKEEFAEYVVKKLLNEYNQETGASYIEEALDNVFYEMMEEPLEFIKYSYDEEYNEE